MMLPTLTIAPSEHRGRGVFTTEPIAAGTVIEISPVIVLSAKERAHAEKTLLYDYLFEWGKKGKKACVALGYVSIYNHSYDANCEYEMDFETELMTVRTVKDIQKGEELFFNYNAIPDSKKEIWFQAQ